MNAPALPPDRFRGMMPILPTPIDAEGAIDESSLRRLVHYALGCGAAAIGHFGFASEFHKLAPDDRRRITETLVHEVDGRVPVFLGVTAPSSRAAIAQARQAAALGADLLMAATPYVSVPDGDDAFQYFRAVALATDLPLILQDTPASAHLLTPEFWVRLADAAPTVRYVKVEGADFMAKMGRLLDVAGDRLQAIGGFGGKHMIHMLRLGVTAFMTGTEMLELHAGIVRAFLGGERETAARLYFERLLPYFMFYDACPEELLKAMLHRRGIIACPAVIPPRSGRPMSETEWREFEWVLDRIGFDRLSPSQAEAPSASPFASFGASHGRQHG